MGRDDMRIDLAQFGVINTRERQMISHEGLLSSDGFRLKPNDPVQLHLEQDDLLTVNPSDKITGAWYLPLEAADGVLLIAVEAIIGTEPATKFVFYSQSGAADEDIGDTRTYVGVDPHVIAYQEGFLISTSEVVVLLIQPPAVLVKNLEDNTGTPESWWKTLQWVDVTPKDSDDTAFKITNIDLGAGTTTTTPALNSSVQGLDNTAGDSTNNQWAGNEILVYWYAYYSYGLGLLLPVIPYKEYLDDDYIATKRAIAVQVDGTNRRGAIIDVSSIDGETFMVENNLWQFRYPWVLATQPVIWDQIRIYRHRCADATEALAMIRGLAPLQGALIQTMYVDDSSGSYSTTWQDEGLDGLYDGSVSWPLVIKQTGGLELYAQSLYAKQPFKTGLVFQGGLLTDAPYISDDVVLYAPPGQPLASPPLNSIHLTTSGNDTILGMVDIDSAAIILMKEGIHRINYIPFGGTIQATSVSEEVISSFGCVGEKSFTIMEQGSQRLLVFLNTDGNLIATPGRGYIDFCPNFNLHDSDVSFVSINDAVMELDTNNHRILLYINGQYTARFDFYYHESHLLNGRTKLMGPNLQYNDVRFSTRGRGGSGNRVWVAGDGAMYRVNGASTYRTAEVTTGTLRNPDPVRAIRLTNYAYIHSLLNPTAVVTLTPITANRGAQPVEESPVVRQNLDYSGFTKGVLRVHFEDYSTWRLKISGATIPGSIGPLYLEAHDTGKEASSG